ncbi:hypothetical protein [Nocardia salmonicida]|uniref:hypothetical protein n=1 Tax=Nocardia salmonicida TaxID=53431 RepID=UPI0037BD8DE5
MLLDNHIRGEEWATDVDLRQLVCASVRRPLTFVEIFDVDSGNDQLVTPLRPRPRTAPLVPPAE